MSNRTQKEIVLNQLENGKVLTANQLRNVFRIGNPYEVVRRLRAEGNAIYTNTKNGKSFYRLGNPRKSAVATQYRLNGANAFSE